MDGEIKSDDPSELAFSQEELEFLKESLENVNILDGYCYGFHDFDNIAALEDFLENYQMISSTGFVHEESHSREKQHKRYSATGILFVYCKYRINILLACQYILDMII